MNELIFELCLDIKSILWISLSLAIKINQQIGYLFKFIKKGIENLQFE